MLHSTALKMGKSDKHKSVSHKVWSCYISHLPSGAAISQEKVWGSHKVVASKAAIKDHCRALMAGIHFQFSL
jgi:hypothetical protein